MGIWWYMITLFDRLKLDYRKRIEAIRKEYPCTYSDLFKALDDRDSIGSLPMKTVTSFMLHNVIRSYNEAYQMFYSQREYEAQWARHVEEKMRYEAQKEMEGEGGYE